MTTTDRRSLALIGLLLGLVDCSTTSAVGQSPSTAQQEFAPRILKSNGEVAPVTAAESETAPLPGSVRVLLFPDDAWAAKDVCEVMIPVGGPLYVRWRILPTGVLGQIRDGGVPDSLHAYVDDTGIVDCVMPGCWTEMPVDARGCAVVCARNHFCASREPGRVDVRQ